MSVREKVCGAGIAAMLVTCASVAWRATSEPDLYTYTSPPISIGAAKVRVEMLTPRGWNVRPATGTWKGKPFSGVLCDPGPGHTWTRLWNRIARRQSNPGEELIVMAFARSVPAPTRWSQSPDGVSKSIQVPNGTIVMDYGNSRSGVLAAKYRSIFDSVRIVK